MEGQANFFLSKINLVAGNILALDWEDPKVSDDQKDEWIEYVQDKTDGHKVLLYCNRDFWLKRDKTSFAGDGLWIAQYNGKPGEPDIKHRWRFHQYTSEPIDTNLGEFDSREALRPGRAAKRGTRTRSERVRSSRAVAQGPARHQ